MKTFYNILVNIINATYNMINISHFMISKVKKKIINRGSNLLERQLNDK